MEQFANNDQLNVHPWQCNEIIRKVTSALDFKEEVESSCLQNLLISDPDRYWTLLCDRNQDDAQMALTLPAQLQHENQDTFRMYLEYRVSSGMSIRAALHMIETALNSFLDQL